MKRILLSALLAALLLFSGCQKEEEKSAATKDNQTEITSEEGTAKEPSATVHYSDDADANVGSGTESKEENGESDITEIPTVNYSYALGLKSLEKAEGVLPINGVSVVSEKDELKVRTQKLFSEGGTELALVLDPEFSIEGVTEELAAQGYKIEVGASITVTAATEVGLYYGARTVSDYVKLQSCMEKGVYTDWPDVKERTLHFDIARKYFTKNFIIEMIESAAASKMNAVELHFSENEGFRIECETDPAIMSDQYLTKDEVREIIAAAGELYVDIIPSFDSPGHLLKILSAHPEYTLTDVDGYNSPKTLDITNPDAVAYIKSLLDEFAELFAECKCFNIGGDESFGWSDIDRMQFGAWKVLENYSKERYGESANAHDAFVGYMNDIANHMISKGFIVRAWNDGLMRTKGQAAVEKPNPEIEICYWTNGGVLRADSAESFISNGNNIYNVNESFMYYVLKEDFDQPKATVIFKEWNAGTILGSDYSSAADVGEALKGAYFCIWCDRPNTQTPEEVKKGSGRPMAAMALKAWNGKPNIDFTDFAAQYNVLIGA